MSLNVKSHLFFLRVFYAFSLAALLNIRFEVTKNAALIATADWIWPVKWMSLIHWPNPLWTVYALSLICTVLTIAWPGHRILRTTMGVLWFFLLASTYSFGNISCAYFGWLTAAILLVFESKSKPYIFTEIAQIFCYSIYFNSGLWKLRAVWGYQEGWNEWTQQMPYHLAKGLAEGMGNVELMNLLTKWPILSGLTWFVVIALELAAGVGVLFPRHNLLWAFLMIAVHAGSAFTLNIEFNSQILLIIVLFIVYPGINAICQPNSKAKL